MIKAKEFYEEFKKNDGPLTSSGIKRQSGGKYATSNKTVLQPILNKWGWTEDEG